MSARAGGGAWDRGRKVAMWMFAILFSVPVITNAAAQSCPPNQIASDAQIVLYMWQSRVEIEDYSALAKNELVMLIEALGRPQLFAEVLALIVA